MTKRHLRKDDLVPALFRQAHSRPPDDSLKLTRSGKILGFHIIGPYAPMLIQEVIDAMANQVDAGWVSAGLHIHPAMPELVVAALYHLREPD